MDHADLSGAEYVACGVEGDCDTVDVERLIPVSGGDARVVDPGAKNAFAFSRADVSAGSPSGVVAVGVRDEGTVYRHPWVDVEVALLAVESAFSRAEEVSHSG